MTLKKYFVLESRLRLCPGGGARLIMHRTADCAHVKGKALVQTVPLQRGGRLLFQMGFGVAKVVGKRCMRCIWEEDNDDQDLEM